MFALNANMDMDKTSRGNLVYRVHNRIAWNVFNLNIAILVISDMESARGNVSSVVTICQTALVVMVQISVHPAISATL